MAKYSTLAEAGGRFVAYITNHKTGERIYAKSLGKRAFFIPYSSSKKEDEKFVPREQSSSGTMKMAK